MNKETVIDRTLLQLNQVAEKTLKLNNGNQTFSIVVEKFTNTKHYYLTIAGINNRYEVIVEPWAAQKNIKILIDELKLVQPRVILFADFVNPVMAEKLDRNNLFYADHAGNIHFIEQSLRIFTNNNKKINLASKRVRGRAFNAAGIRLIYALFNQPELLQASYRKISQQANIALGSIGPVLDDLERSGYILDEGKRRLVNKKRLFERWVDGYLEKLRPKLLIEFYHSPNDLWWKKAHPEKFEGIWGGEINMAKSLHYVDPESISLYFSSLTKQREFANHYQLQKDPNGNIGIYKIFTPQKILNPMIIYADILDSIHASNWEQAKTFYAQVVEKIIEEES